MNHVKTTDYSVVILPSMSLLHIHSSSLIWHPSIGLISFVIYPFQLQVQCHSLTTAINLLISMLLQQEVYGSESVEDHPAGG